MTSVNLYHFNRSMEKMRRIPKKHGPDVLNKSVLKVGIGSKGSAGLVQLTQKATAARMKRDLMRDKLGIKLAVIALKKKGEKPTNEAVSQMFQTILNKRTQSRAYISAGWLYASSKLAQRVPGQTLTRMNPRNIPKHDGESASESFALVATEGRLQAGLFNTSRGAGAVCPDQVVQMAVNNATEDNNVYLRRKFEAAINDAIADTDTARMVA